MILILNYFCRLSKSTLSPSPYQPRKKLPQLKKVRRQKKIH